MLMLQYLKGNIMQDNVWLLDEKAYTTPNILNLYDILTYELLKSNADSKTIDKTSLFGLDLNSIMSAIMFI